MTPNNLIGSGALAALLGMLLVALAWHWGDFTGVVVAAAVMGSVAVGFIGAGVFVLLVGVGVRQGRP